MQMAMLAVYCDWDALHGALALHFAAFVRASMLKLAWLRPAFNLTSSAEFSKIGGVCESCVVALNRAVWMLSHEQAGRDDICFTVCTFCLQIKRYRHRAVASLMQLNLAKPVWPRKALSCTVQDASGGPQHSKFIYEGPPRSLAYSSRIISRTGCSRHRLEMPMHQAVCMMGGMALVMLPACQAHCMM